MSARTFRGRGVYYLEGTVACPLPGVGARGRFESIRLALDDDDTEVTLEATGRLVVRNERSYPLPTLIGDVIVLGHGQTRSGRRVPIALHTRFDKSRQAVRARPHLHATVAEPLVDVALEPLEIAVAERLVLTTELGRRVATHPPLADWLGRALISIRPNRRPGAAIADVTVRLGVGRLSLPLLRAELFGPRAARDLAALLGTEDWLLRFTVLSRARDLRDHLSRAVFLLGLDAVPELQRIRGGRIRPGDTFAFRMRGGRGAIELGREAAAVPDVGSVIRAYLEYDVLGSVLAQAVARPEPGEIQL